MDCSPASLAADIDASRVSSDATRSRHVAGAPTRPARTTRSRHVAGAPTRPARTTRSRHVAGAPTRPARTTQSRHVAGAPTRPARTARSRHVAGAPTRPARTELARRSMPVRTSRYCGWPASPHGGGPSRVPRCRACHQGGRSRAAVPGPSLPRRSARSACRRDRHP